MTKNRRSWACPVLCRKGGYIQREFSAQPLKDRCQQTVQLMQDIHLMMHADYFVGAPPPFLHPMQYSDMHWSA